MAKEKLQLTSQNTVLRYISISLIIAVQTIQILCMLAMPALCAPNALPKAIIIHKHKPTPKPTKNTNNNQPSTTTKQSHDSEQNKEDEQKLEAFRQIVEKGNTAYESADYTQALDCFQKAIEISKDDASLYNWLGVCYQKLNQPEQALNAFQQAVGLEPNSSKAQNNLAVTAKELQKYDIAETALKKAIEIDPDFLEGHYNLGLVEEQLGKYNDAIAEYELVYNKDPENINAFYGELRCQLRNKNYKGAQSLLEQLPEGKPNNTYVPVQLGLLYLVDDNPDKSQAEAIKYFQKVLSIDEKNFPANLNLGKIYVNAGQFEKGEPYLEKASKVNSANPELCLLMAKVQFQYYKIKSKARTWLEFGLKYHAQNQDLKDALEELNKQK